MAKKKTTPKATPKSTSAAPKAKSAAKPVTAPTVRSLRSAVDRIDKQLIELVNERARLAIELGDRKRGEGRDNYDAVREEKILRGVAQRNKGPLGDDCLLAMFRELISGSRALETMLRIAFLGPSYSYSHLASIHRFGQSVDSVPVGLITAVFESVENSQADFGLVPIENSTDGRIADTLDNFARTPLRICGEVQLKIHHNLLGLCSRADVQEVYSRPQALSQCRNWLGKHLPAARLIEVTSTSTAAQLAREKSGAAAIASRQAGIHCGLDVLAANIEDNQSNVTRFAVISKESGARTGDDKSALMFELEHRAGALADAITIFKRHKVNLTWIESFPMSGSGDRSGPDGGYLFFVELIGHQVDTRIRRMLQSLEKKAVRLVVLGSYARAEVCE